MRRKLLIVAASLLGLIVILSLSALFYVRSGRLDLLLQRQLISALDEAGIRAELAKATLDLRGYTVSLEGLRLFEKKNNKEFGYVDKITARFSVASYLKQRINLTEIDIVHPKVSLEIDKQGRFVLDPLLEQRPKKKEEEKGPVSFFTAKYTIEQGEVDFVDLKREVTVHVGDLKAEFAPLDASSLSDELNHRLQIAFATAGGSYQGRRIEKIGAQIEARVMETNAQIDKFELTSEVANVSLTGRLDSFEPLKYESSDVRVEASADQIARVLAPELGISGRILVTGRVNGTDADYHASGGVASDALIAEGVRISGLHLKTTVQGKGAQYNAVAEAASSAIAGRGFQLGSLALSGARVKGQDDNFSLGGALKLTTLSNGVVRVEGLHGNLAADRKHVGFSDFVADVLGGTLSGSASVGLGGARSEVNAEFKSISLDQAATLAAAKEVKVSGTASGTAAISFPGLAYRQATGRLVAKIDGAVALAESGGDGTPGSGEVIVVATGNGFKLESAEIQSGASLLSATGEVSWEGKGSFDVTFKSSNLAELKDAVDSFGVIPSDVQDRYELAISGEGSFGGHVDVDLASGDADVNGRVQMKNIKLHEEELGAFAGDVSYSASEIRVRNASLARKDGSRADFELTASLSEKDHVSIKANVQEFSLAAIARAAVPGLTDFVGAGSITGTIDLSGLPGPRSIEGVAKVTLSGGEFNVPSPDEGEESRKLSVPEFIGDITFANSVLTVNNLHLRSGDSDVAGTAKFNLDTYEYSVDAGAKNVDLALVSDAVSESLKMTGRADVTVVGQGKWGSADDWSELNVNASIEGHSVVVNGRDLGNAKLNARTDNGLLKIEATGRVAEQMRSVDATVDLRDRKNYPISASIEFTDADIAPYISWVAPQLSEISGRATGSIKLMGPLQSPDDVQVIATFNKLEIGGSIAEGRRYTISNQGDFTMRGSARGVTVDRAVFVGDGTSVVIEGGLAREGSARSSLSINGEVNLRLLSSFTQVVFATGIAQVQASIAGSLETPQLLGVVSLKDIGVRIVDFPLATAHGNGQIRFTSNQALIERFVATTPGGGSISIGGGAALAGLVPDRWRLEVKADQVGAEYPRDTQTVIDASVTLQGNRRVQVLSGDVEVRRASYTKDVTMEELITSGGPFTPEFLEAGPGGSGAPSGLQTTLDLRIVADNTLIVKNNLADAVGSAYLNLRGSFDEPLASGRILLTRGTLEFRNGRWELIRGLTTIPGRSGSEPIIDFQAEADIRGYHLTTIFSGELSKLQVQARSDPELPESQIVSLILTGSISSDRSTVASTSQTGLGLAQSILSASLSEQLERGTQRLFGLSRFSIDPLLVGRGTDPTARITVGQRVTKDLTVTYSQNLSSGSAGTEQVVLVEYRLSNRFSVVGYRNESGELGFDVRLRKRF